MTRLPLPEPKKYFGVDAEPDFLYFTAGQMYAYSDAENAALRDEAETFHTAYRMKCDVETKALAEQVRVLREANAILTAEIDTLRYERDLLRIVVMGTAAADELLENPAAIFRLARIAREALGETK